MNPNCDQHTSISRRERLRLRRLCWWANFHADPDQWLRYANAHGYEVWGDATREIELDRDGHHLATLRRTTTGGWFLFLWTPQAGAPWWSEVRWRITHPRTPRKPMPRRVST